MVCTVYYSGTVTLSHWCLLTQQVWLASVFNKVMVTTHAGLQDINILQPVGLLATSHRVDYNK